MTQRTPTARLHPSNQASFNKRRVQHTAKPSLPTSDVSFSPLTHPFTHSSFSVARGLDDDIVHSFDRARIPLHMQR